MSEQVPEATNENEVQMLHAEMDAHCKIADLCFAAGAETDDGTSVGAVRGLVKLLAQAQASLAAARAEALEQEPWLYAIAEPNGHWRDGESCVFGDRETCQEYVDQDNDDIEDGEPKYTVVPLYRRTPSDSTALAKLLAEERLRMLDKFDSLLSQIKTECLQSSRGTQLGEGVETGRKDVKDWLAARVAELKGEQKA